MAISLSSHLIGSQVLRFLFHVPEILYVFSVFSAASLTILFMD